MLIEIIRQYLTDKGITAYSTFKIDAIGKLSLCQINCIGLSPETKLQVACVLPPTSSSSGNWNGIILGGSVSLYKLSAIEQVYYPETKGN